MGGGSGPGGPSRASARHRGVLERTGPGLALVLMRVLRRFGLTVSSTSLREPTLDSLLRHVVDRGVRPRTVIDAGVAYGTPELYAHFPKAQQVLFEPLDEFSSAIDAIGRQFRVSWVKASAGAASGRASIQVRPDLGSSSVYPEEGVTAVARDVDVRRVDDEVRRLGFPGPYVLKADVQGSELAVMEGSRGIFRDLDLVILETTLLSSLEGAPEFAETIAAMRQWGFVVFDIVDLKYRPSDRSLGQADLAFVPVESRLRRDRHWR